MDPAPLTGSRVWGGHRAIVTARFVSTNTRKRLLQHRNPLPRRKVIDGPLGGLIITLSAIAGRKSTRTMWWHLREGRLRGLPGPCGRCDGLRPRTVAHASPTPRPEALASLLNKHRGVRASGLRPLRSSGFFDIAGRPVEASARLRFYRSPNSACSSAVMIPRSSASPLSRPIVGYPGCERRPRSSRMSCP